MKKNNLLVAILLMSVAALNLQGMDDGDGYRTPPRGQRVEAPLSRAVSIALYKDIKEGLENKVNSLKFSAERDSSVEVLSWRLNPLSNIRARERGARIQHRQAALQELDVRIAALKVVANQARTAGSESQQVLGGVKMAHEFSSVKNKAGMALFELTTLRDDLANGGNLLAKKVAKFNHAGRNLLPPFDASVAPDELGMEPPFFQLPS